MRCASAGYLLVIIGCRSLVQGMSCMRHWCKLTSQGVREDDLVRFQILRRSFQSLEMQGFLAVCTNSSVRRVSCAEGLTMPQSRPPRCMTAVFSNYWAGRTFHSGHLSPVVQADTYSRCHGQVTPGALAMCIRMPITQRPRRNRRPLPQSISRCSPGLPYLAWLAILQSQEVGV